MVPPHLNPTLNLCISGEERITVWELDKDSRYFIQTSKFECERKRRIFFNNISKSDCYLIDIRDKIHKCSLHSDLQHNTKIHPTLISSFTWGIFEKLCLHALGIQMLRTCPAAGFCASFSELESICSPIYEVWTSSAYPKRLSDIYPQIIHAPASFLSLWRCKACQRGKYHLGIRCGGKGNTSKIS